MQQKPNTRKKITILIDALMYILLLLQMLYVFTGNNIHEILGISFMVCVIAHLFMKRKWFAALIKRKSSPGRARLFADVITVLLLLLILLLAISSMGVSRVMAYLVITSPKIGVGVSVNQAAPVLWIALYRSS